MEQENNIKIGNKIKFNEQISNELFILEGIITNIIDEKVYMDCNRYPWKCDRVVEVVKNINDLK